MKILLERTDETHSITMPEIIDALAAYDISAECKTGKIGSRRCSRRFPMYCPLTLKFVPFGIDILLATNASVMAFGRQR